MSIEGLPDGSLRILEHYRLARFGLLAFTVLVAAVIGYGGLSGVEIFHPAWGWLIGAAVAFGVATLLEDLDIEFDLSERKVHWQRKRLFAKTGGNIPMEAIQDITLSIAGTDDTRLRRPQYRLLMVTREGTIPLSSRHTTDKRELEQTAQTLLALLQKSPAGDIVDRSLNDAIAHGRTVEAAHWFRRRDGLDATRAKKRVDEMGRRDKPGRVP